MTKQVGPVLNKADNKSDMSRSAGGVRVFDTAADEKVVSVARIAEQADDDEAPEADE